MKMLQCGDRCPICGQPIMTNDPEKLIFLSAMAWWARQGKRGTNFCHGSGGSTNLDKVRSLPDDALSPAIICPMTAFGKPTCDDPENQDCISCTQKWLGKPYRGWDVQL